MFLHAKQITEASKTILCVVRLIRVGKVANWAYLKQLYHMESERLVKLIKLSDFVITQNQETVKSKRVFKSQTAQK